MTQALSGDHVNAPQERASVWLGIGDFVKTAKLLPMAFHFAWGDTKARYRRSVLGPFWIVLGTSFGVAGLGYVWSTVLKVDRASFIPSLTIGLIVWQFISGCIVESPLSLVRSSQTIRNIPTPYIIFPAQLLIRQFINFMHNMIVVAVVLFIYPPAHGWVQALLLPGLALVIVNLGWISVVLSLIGARFRDLDLLVGALMPIFFFISPVIYRPEHLASQEWLIAANPLAYLITVMRDPLQGIVPPTGMYLALIMASILGWTAAFWLLGRRYSRIAFWV